MSDELLDAYVRSSRKVFPAGRFIDQSFLYKHYYEFVSARLRPLYATEEPTLKVVYSNDRLCELVKIRDRWYFIYDQYLGETFNLLNRILFNSNSPDYPEAFALKCIAQKLISLGHPRLAALIALAYDELHPVQSLPKFQNKNDRELLIRLQEMFVIAHELCHHVTNHHNPFAALQVVRAEWLFSEAERSVDKVPSLTQRRKFAKQHGFPQSKKYWQSSQEERRRFVDAEKPRYINEVACDIFAFETCLAYVQKAGEDLTLAGKATLLALRYLRILQHCREMAESFAGHPGERAMKLMRVAAMREHALRAAFRSPIDVPIDPDGSNILSAIRANSDSFIKAINAIANRVDKVVYYPIVFRLPDLLEKIKPETAVSEWDANDEELIRMVEAVTGPNR